MSSDFKNAMSKRSDQDLIKIVTIEREDYQPLAIEAAEAEIKTRNIDISLFQEALTTEQTKPNSSLNLVKVTRLSRFINFVVDTIIWIIIVAILTAPLNAQDDFEMLIGYLIMIVIFFSYYILLETKYQKTVGKFLTKTKVINNDESKPNFKDILRRTCCRIIPFDAISFLFSHNGFHDRLSDTHLTKD